MIRCSSIGRFLACPMSETLRHGVQPSLESALIGSEIHKYCETEGSYTPRNVGGWEWGKKLKYCKTLPDDAARELLWWDARVKRERNLVWNRVGMFKHLPRPISNFDIDRHGFDLSGTCDIIFELGNELHVYDVKTGAVAVDVIGNPQLMSYAMAFQWEMNAKYDRFVFRIIDFPARPYKTPPSHTEWTCGPGAMRDFEASVRSAFSELECRELLSPNYGEHCTFCPAKRSCPAWEGL